MKRITLGLLFLLLTQVLLLTQQVQSRHCPAGDSISLNQVRTLTLYRDRMTTFLHTDKSTYPIPQVQCFLASTKRRHKFHKGEDYCPDVVQLENRGTDDYGNVQWKAEADIGSDWKMGRVEVSCVSCGSDKVLKGSCGVEIEMIPPSTSTDGDSFFSDSSDNSGDVSIGLVIVIILIIIVVAVLCAKCSSTGQPTMVPPRRSTYAGENVYAEASAPPYDVDPPAYSRTTYTNSNNNSSWWSGFGWGSATGYGLGRSTPSSTTHHHYHHHTGGNTTTSSSTPRSSSSKDNTSDSTKSRRTATGYGGTKMR